MSDSAINLDKKARIPEKRFLERLFNRNEFYIESKHPLAETIVNQMGQTKELRRKFLEENYNLALSLSIQKWKPMCQESTL